MSWTPEDVKSYNKLLDEEAVVSKLLREAREGEDAAAWYLDSDSETKAAEWYYGANQRYVLAFVYSLGLILGLTVDQISDQWASVEDAWLAALEAEGIETKEVE